MTQSPTPPAVQFLLLSRPPHPPLPDPAPVAYCRCPVTPPLPPAHHHHPRHHHHHHHQHRPLLHPAVSPPTSDPAAGTCSSDSRNVGSASQRRYLTSRSCGLRSSLTAAASKTLQWCRTLLELPAVSLLLLFRLRRKGRRHRLTQVRGLCRDFLYRVSRNPPLHVGVCRLRL